jgi:hypothetical protein
VITIVSVASLACSRADTTRAVYGSKVDSTPFAVPQTRTEEQSQIRKIDFKNFEYPAKPIYSDGEHSFKLRNGTFKGRHYAGSTGLEPVYLTQVVYGDVTGDGKEEAILVLFENVRGSAIPYYVYVYTLNSGKPGLLWSFQTGDRGDGGLRQAYAENAELVIDLYGKDTVVNENLEDKEVLGACCPKSFTRSRYKWDGKEFRRQGSEVLPNPLSNAELLPPKSVNS